MKRTAPLLFAVILASGCNNHSDLMPFLGKWSGGFVVTSISTGGTASDLKREQLNGFVQIYATKRSYKMELEGEQETIRIDGNWTIRGKQITLNPKDLVIDDKGGSAVRDPNKKFIPSEDVRAAYGRPMVLTESNDKKNLHGPETTVGHLLGHHDFVKDSF